MKNLKKILFISFKVIIALYLLVCVLFYFFQEKFIFLPEKLSQDHQFSFDQEFEEVNIKTKDNKTLNGVLFKSEEPRGLVLYLHGDQGYSRFWGDFTKPFTDLNYDVYVIDYRGYGKSQGKISNEKQIHEDIQIAYNMLLERYDESNIIVLGYSLGTGIATKLASTNNPKSLILLAPYFSLTDMLRHTYPFIPGIFLKYKFKTNKHIVNCKMPIYIFHGNKDSIIYYNSSIKLKEIIKEKDKHITIDGKGHDWSTWDTVYTKELETILD